MRIRFRTFLFLLGLISLMIMTSQTAVAQMSDKEKAKQIKKAGETAKKASKTLDELMRIQAKSIPEALLKDAKAIAVFPGVLKAAFGIGGSGGQGLISRRLKSGWSAPTAFKIASGSVGFQIGGSSTDYVLLFMTENSLKNLLEDQFEIGGEASAAAGPVGRTAKASTDAQLQAQILSYSRSKGLFAGVSLTGAVISSDNDRNQALYGFNAKELLTGDNKVSLVSIPAATKGFQETIARYAK
ncbi:MAG: lipid-binding SYLF domain-containing protein [Pyrinomonadaceae bacterium]|nr:lipid-binding SYLF domain-containing protein [Acidobacteriota bacterium]MBK7932156.1 lipid-binding SYLF domain-containing protein [Acidobacteriota bacterium]MBP7376577.1 lipid-binding SYLF domain-containing protein [Pyrinomonadaceae bacterium]